MSKIHHLTGAQLRDWQANAHLLISPEGHIHRDATRDEAVLQIPVEEDGVQYQLVRARDRMQQELHALYPDHATVMLRHPSGRIIAHLKNPLKAAARLSETGERRRGPGPDQCQCKDWVDREPGRHHHACVHNRMAPKGEQASSHVSRMQKRSRVYNRGGTLIPSPAKPATPPAVAAVNTRAARAARRAAAAPNLPAPKSLIPLTAPGDCPCKDYTGTVAGQHHKACARKAAWEEANPIVPGVQHDAPTQAETPILPGESQDSTQDLTQTETPILQGEPQDAQSPQEAAGQSDEQDVGLKSETGYYLYDTVTRQVARAADSDEVAEVEGQPVPLITLQNRQYAVVHESQLKAS